MAGELIIPSGAIVQGNLTVTGSMLPAIARTKLATDQSASYPIAWEAWRVWDAYGTNLPATGGTDDLGLYGGTFTTNTPSIQTGDVKTTSGTRYARCVVMVPPNFVTGGTFKIRAHAGAKTTAADGSMTIDFQAYRSDKEDSLGSDLVTTAATTINSTSKANKDFTVDSATLIPGDLLDIRMAVTWVDTSAVTAVIGFVGSVEILMDIQG